MSTPAKIVSSISNSNKNGPTLIRKSFEYGEDFLSAEEILRKEPMQSYNNSTDAFHKNDIYWALEHARWNYIRSYNNYSYLEYLPGRVYSYRILASRILQSINIDSTLDVGCGSGMMVHECQRLGIRSAGCDISHYSIKFAETLAQDEYGYEANYFNTDVMRDTYSDRPYDLVSNLGSLEHFSYHQQLRFIQFMASASRRYLLLAIPEKQSELFQTMENAELSLSDPDLVYPEEWDQQSVQFERLRKTIGASLVERGGVHLAPTTLSGYPEEVRKYLGTDFVTNFETYANKVATISAKELSIEASILEGAAWFTYEIWDLEGASFSK